MAARWSGSLIKMTRTLLEEKRREFTVDIQKGLKSKD